MTTAVDVMVITAHPDDAEFGVAGTVARWTREGKQVVYVVCTNGNKGTSDRSLKPEDLAKIRQREQEAAAKTLGVQEVVFLGYHDQELEDTPEFRKQLVRLIRMYRPPSCPGCSISLCPGSPGVSRFAGGGSGAAQCGRDMVLGG